MKGQNRVIIKAAVARKLLKMGFKIIDLKPQKQENGVVDFTRCVFVFEARNGLDKAIEHLC